MYGKETILFVENGTSVRDLLGTLLPLLIIKSSASAAFPRGKPVPTAISNDQGPDAILATRPNALARCIPDPGNPRPRKRHLLSASRMTLTRRPRQQET